MWKCNFPCNIAAEEIFRPTEPPEAAREGVSGLESCVSGYRVVVCR